MVQHTSEGADNGDFIPFAMVPTWLLRSGGKLSGNAVRLYGVILSYADNITREAYPARETLATDMGVSVATVKRAIKELEDSGAVSIERVRTKKGGNFSSNKYTLALESPWVTGEPRNKEYPSPRVTDEPRPRVTDEPPPWVKDDPITRPNLTKSITPKNPHLQDVSLSGAEKPDSSRNVENKNDDDLPASQQKKRATPETIEHLRKALRNVS